MNNKNNKNNKYKQQEKNEKINNEKDNNLDIDNLNDLNDLENIDIDFHVNHTQMGRFKEIIGILIKHKIAKGLNPVKLRMILEDLGPVYIKLGQIVSMRTDLLPDEYLVELSKLRSDVVAQDFSTIKRIIEKEYDCPIDEIFTSFNKYTVGSASIAQTHKAQIKDGKEVIVKVQREGIMKRAENDIKLMKKASKLFKIVSVTENVLDFNMILDELWETTKKEMDFVFEAENMKKFYELNKNEEGIACPKVMSDISNSKILVMEYIEGISLEEMDKLRQKGIDTRNIGKRLAKNFFKQVIEDGFFHADPHSGNIIIKDNDIVWIDMGMMGTISNKDRKMIKKMVVAIVANDMQDLKDLIIEFGNPSKPIDHMVLASDVEKMVNKYIDMDLEKIDLPLALKEILDLAKKHGISMPSGITMLARGLATIESVIQSLSPDINLLDILADYISKSLYSRLDYKEELKKYGKLIINNSKKTIQLPAILSDFIKSLAKGRNRIHLELSSSYHFEHLIKKVTRSISVSIVIMGLLIGAGLMSIGKKDGMANAMIFVAIVLFLIQIISYFKDKKK